MPVSCPVHSLIAFTKTSHYKAKQLARKYERFAATIYHERPFSLFACLWCGFKLFGCVLYASLYIHDCAPRQQKVTSESLEQCRKALRLLKLTRNQVVTDSQVQQSCRELLKLGSTHRNMLEGHHFCLSAYYSVTPDGYIRIPWNWVLSD